MRFNIIKEFKIFFLSLGGQGRDDISKRITQGIIYGFDFNFLGFDLGKIQDIVDNGH